MNKRNYLKGGVVLADSYKNLENGADIAFQYYLDNTIKVKLLTDTSISCFTYIFYLNPNIISPYIFIRGNNFNNPVNSILLKIGLLSKTNIENDYYENTVIIRTSNNKNTREGKKLPPFQQVTIEEVIKEVNIQNDIFQKSYLEYDSIFEPVCPAIINYSTEISKDFKDKILNIITNKIEERPNYVNFKDKILDLDATKSLFLASNNIYIISMEFMDGYDTLINFQNISREKYKMYQDMHLYELSRIKNFGYFHVDSHYNNVMINPDYPYFTNDKTSAFYGRAIIIDFGRVEDINFIKDNNINKFIVGAQGTNKGYIPLDILNIRPGIFNKFQNLRSIMSAQLIINLDNNKKKIMENAFSKNNIIVNLDIYNSISSNYINSEINSNQSLNYISSPSTSDSKSNIKSTESYNSFEMSNKDTSLLNKYSSPDINIDSKISPIPKMYSSENNLNLAYNFYQYLTGNLPGVSIIFSNWNFWNWQLITGWLKNNSSDEKDINININIESSKKDNKNFINSNLFKNNFKKKNNNLLSSPDNTPEPNSVNVKNIPNDLPNSIPNNNIPNNNSNINIQPPIKNNNYEEEISDCKAAKINVPKCFINSKSYKDLTLKLHPDRNPTCPDISKQKFQELSNNYDLYKSKYGDFSDENYNKCLGNNLNYNPVNNNNTNNKEEKDAQKAYENQQNQFKKDEQFSQKQYDNSKREKTETQQQNYFQEQERQHLLFKNITQVLNSSNTFDSIKNYISNILIRKLVSIYNYELNLLNNNNQSIDLELEIEKIVNEKQNVENCKLELQNNIENYRKFLFKEIQEYLNQNNITINDESIQIIINAYIDFKIRYLLVEIERIFQSIFYLELELDELFSEKMDIDETVSNEILNSNEKMDVEESNTIDKLKQIDKWFGLPKNPYLTKREISYTKKGGSNNEMSIYKNNNKFSIFSYIPVFGIKYEIATTPLKELIFKNNIGELQVLNLNIPDIQFKNNLELMYQNPKPFSIKSKGGKKFFFTKKTFKKSKNNNKKNKSKKRIKNNNSKKHTLKNKNSKNNTKKYIK